jgi:hypothetical protein
VAPKSQPTGSTDSLVVTTHWTHGRARLLHLDFLDVDLVEFIAAGKLAVSIGTGSGEFAVDYDRGHAAYAMLSGRLSNLLMQIF